MQKNSGTTVLDQQRDHNMVNEIDTDETHGDADNPITETTGTAWADPIYDANGNMTTMPLPKSPTSGKTATYDAWNRLVEVRTGFSLRFKAEYDGLNRRVQAGNGILTVAMGPHFFYNASWQVLETRYKSPPAEPETNQPQYQYVWSPRYIDAPILRDKNTDDDDLCDDQRLYYLGDANFNITTLVDTAGDAVERYVYAPYGVPTIYDGTWSTPGASSYSNVYLYTGRERDGLTTGLYYNRGRYYHAQLGRFISRDPIESDLNLYRYAGSNPLANLDPIGLAWVEASKKVQWKLKGNWGWAAGGAGWPSLYMKLAGESDGNCSFKRVLRYGPTTTRRWFWFSKRNAGETIYSRDPNKSKCCKEKGGVQCVEWGATAVWSTSKLTWLPVPAKWSYQPAVWALKLVFRVEGSFTSLLGAEIHLKICADGTSSAEYITRDRKATGWGYKATSGED